MCCDLRIGGTRHDPFCLDHLAQISIVFLEEPVTATHECDREISGAVPEAGTSRVIDPIPPIRPVNIVRESGSFKLPVEDTISDLVGKTLQNSKVGKGLDSRGPVVIQRLQ